MTPTRLRALATEILAPRDGSGSLAQWAFNCHAASAQLVKTEAFQNEVGPCRVARGACVGVAGQHSWVVLGDNCYNDRATIVDPTLWSYDESVKGVWVGSYRDKLHRPHGKGSIFRWGRPDPAIGPEVKLTPTKPLSGGAQAFLELLGPLDKNGWRILAHAPVEGWPAGEIIEAMLDTEGLSQWIPIDIVGMVTDRNPEGLYL